MTDKVNRYIIYTVIGLAIFVMLGVIGLTVYVASCVSKDVSFEEWISASKKFSKDAVEMDDPSIKYLTCPDDKELIDFFKQHKKDFETMNAMFLEDNLSSLNSLLAYDKENRMAIYPYVKKLKLGDDSGKEHLFTIEKERYDKYRTLMKACKVDEIQYLGEDKEIGVGFRMFNESLEPGKEADDADFFKRKGVSYWKNPDFQTYDSTSDIAPDDGYTYGAVKIDSQPNWYVWLWVQSQKSK